MSTLTNCKAILRSAGKILLDDLPIVQWITLGLVAGAAVSVAIVTLVAEHLGH